MTQTGDQAGQPNFLCLVFLLFWLMGLPSACYANYVICVCAESLDEAWKPWVAYRQEQGYEVAIVRPDGSAAEIREAIKKAAISRSLQGVVLLGDTPSYADGKLAPRLKSHVPTFYSQAKVNVLFGSEPELASDFPYGDLNGDGVPDLPVGRIPVTSSEQLTRYVQRVIAYERKYPAAVGKRDIHFVAGVGGFGPAVDGVLTTVTRKFISQGIPGSFRVTMTQASWQSPFCPDPFAFGKHTVDRMNEGGLFWIYMGHGLRDQLDQVFVPGVKPISIMRQDNLKDVAVRGLPPICVFLACYVGAFDSVKPCIGEQLVLLEDGPIAVLAASRVSMPYAMSVMGDGMLRQCFRLREEILGNVIANAKRSLVVPSAADRTPNRMLLDSLAGKLSPVPKMLIEEREEHALMFNLLGDPLLRVNYPRGVKLNCAATASNGSNLLVRFEAPVKGKAVLELAAERGVQRFTPLKRESFDREMAESYNDEYRRANDAVWSSTSLDICQPGTVEAEIAVERVKPGFQTVRLYLQSDQQVYIGSKRVYVSK